MTRPLRVEFPGALYHVTARGNERKPIYRADADRRRFLGILAAVVDQFRLVLHAYVLMDNHYHLLVATLDANLQRAMREINGTYAQSFNQRYGRVGHLFQGRYKAPLVDRDSYLVELSRYIHLNPVRAGIVADAEQYVWSSAAAYVGESAAPRFLTVSDVLDHFGGGARQDQMTHYREFLSDRSAGRVGSPVEEAVAQMLLGKGQWVNDMRARVGASLCTEQEEPRGSGEIPARRQLRCRPTLEQIVVQVAAATGVAPEVLCRPGYRSTGRSVAIHLAVKLSGLSQMEIGVTFGIGRFAVSKASAMVDREVGVSNELCRFVTNVKARLAGSPGGRS